MAKTEQTYQLAVKPDKDGGLNAVLTDSQGKSLDDGNALPVDVAQSKTLKVEVVNADDIAKPVAKAVQSDGDSSTQYAISETQFQNLNAQVQGLGTLSLLLVVGVFLLLGVNIVRYFFDGVDGR